MPIFVGAAGATGFGQVKPRRIPYGGDLYLQLWHIWHGQSPSRRASGFFGWTTVMVASSSILHPSSSLRSLVLDPASPMSPREVKVSD